MGQKNMKLCAMLCVLTGLVTNSPTLALAAGKRAEAAHAASASKGPTSATLAEGVRLGPLPAWVKDPGVPAAASPATPQAAASADSGRARRDLLIDTQIQLGEQGQTTFIRHHRMALDTSTLKEVSEPAIVFNPAYQSVTLHSVQVVRNGQRTDRTREVRVELLRREQALEQQMLDGLSTALIVLRDIRVGDVVEVSYSVRGSNPIFDGRYSELLQLASDAPADRIHLRIEAPLSRKLQVKGIPLETQVERFEEGGHQVIRVVRDHVATIAPEAAVPPWVKVYPAIHVSEYTSWAEVDQWAQRLFADAPPTGEVSKRIEALRASGLSREALLSDVLRFVQDDVRYFSRSLGESSHRPHPAAQTLADRMGDCKDKVMLLNTLLKGLGYDARPALVSTYRHRGLLNYLPSHEEFDHVVSAVTLDGQRYLLDPTLNGQGTTLKGRGYMNYGAVLIVGEGKGPELVNPPAFARDDLVYQQSWDVSKLKEPTSLNVTMTASGLGAERWRASTATNGLDRIGEAVASTYQRLYPGLRLVGKPEVDDQRDSNQYTMRLQFEHPKFGQYRQGVLEVELIGMEVGEMLSLPPEPNRQLPFWLTQPNSVELRVRVRTPYPFNGALPSPRQVQDSHFSVQGRMESKGQDITLTTRFERKADEVRPGALAAFRDTTQKARQTFISQNLRMLLLDRTVLEPTFTAIDQRLRPYRNGRQGDALMRILQEQELARSIAALVLPQLPTQGQLTLKVLTDSAMANNMLADFQKGLQEAQTALAIDPASTDALEAQGVALMGLKRTDEAISSFQRQQAASSNATASWLGIAQYVAGNDAQAEQTLRAQLPNVSGDEKTFALIWAYLATERRTPGQGAATIDAELQSLDRQTWPGAIPHFLKGNIGQDELLKIARKEPDQERLRLAEAYFYMGEQMLLRGDKNEARRAFERCRDTRAVPYRELTLAELELSRLR